MAKTISQRIALEGGDELKKKFEELGKAGEKSFKQIQDAAAKTKVDPAQFAQTKQQLDGLVTTGTQLANQFLRLAQAATSFGTQGAQATAAVTAGLNQTNTAAQQTGAIMARAGQQTATAGEAAGSSLISTANKWRLAAVGIVAAIGAVVNALTKGAVETGAKIAGEAEKLKLSTAEWVKLREAIAGAGGSFDNFIKGAGKTVDLIEKMKAEIAKVSTTFKVLNEAGELVDVTTTAFSKLTKETAEAVTMFRQLGVSMKTLQSGDTLKILTETAAIINRMPEGLKKSALGVQFFGDSWKEVIKALLAAQTATVDPLEAMRKKSRELTAEQVDTAKKVKDAWADLGAAIRATRDQIGALFAPGELARVEWLRDLVDDSRRLVLEWLKLGGAATVFKILEAVGQQLAGIWRDVLVPAGTKVLGIIRNIAAAFPGVTSEQVIAFFITAAAAVTAFAVAFKGIAFVLSPFTALIGLLASFGPLLIPLIALVVLFWDQIKAGASSLAGMLAPAIETFKQGMQALFAGDFAGAWAKFGEAAVSAFNIIKTAAVQTFNAIWESIKQSEGVLGDFIRAISGEGVVKQTWIKEFVDAVKQIGVELPSTLVAIAVGLVLLRKAGVALAPIMSKIVGVELTASGAVVLAMFGSMTGAVQALAAVVTGLSAALLGLVSIFKLIGMAAGALGAVFGISFGVGLVIVGLFIAALALLILYWPQIKQAAADALTWIEAKVKVVKAVFEAWVATPVKNAWQWVVDIWTGIGEWFAEKITQAKALIQDLVTAPVAGAWQWMVTAFDAVVAQIAAKSEILKNILLALLAPGGLAGLAAKLGAGAGGSGNAAGGLLGGRGTGTSDSNLAWVSRGEYITPARAVRQPGVLAFLEALRRSGGNLRDVLNGMGRFALGGMVARPIAIPAFAAGGSTRDLGTLHLALPSGQTFAVRASSDVVDELRKAAAMAQVRSGGRKPSRYS